MQNQNKISRQSPITVTSKLLFTLVTLVAFQFYATAQTRFTRTTFNAAYTPISVGGGATSSTATGDNANQTGIPIGFSFGYADSTFSSVGLSTNGMIWFDAVAPAVGTSVNNLVSTGTPNQSLAPWFNNLIDDASSDILYQTQGAPGSRIFTVQYTNYPTFTGTPGSNVRMNCQIILYETTNVIEFRYGTLNVTGSQTTSGGGYIGMEWGTGGSGNYIDAITGSSIVNNKMLSPMADWPSYNFRFTPGIPSTIPAGTYNVGVGQTYNSLTQAVADVNHRGINGAVTLNLTDAQYDTTAANGSNIFPIFVATPNADSINLLTIAKTGNAATLAYRGSNISASGAGYGTGANVVAIGHGLVPLLAVCASYTTISNLNLITHGLGVHQVEVGLLQCELFGNKGAQHNFYDKISIDLDRNQGGCYGIYSFNTTAPGGLAGTNSYNTWRDINIKDCNTGFTLSGVNTATGPADYGNQIITSSCNTFNYIGDPNVADDIISGSPTGIYVTGQSDFTIRNCIIQNLTATGVFSTSGIFVTNSLGSNEISNNIIRTIRRTSTTLNTLHWLSGIRINWPNQTMSFKVFNNSISNLLSAYAAAPTTHYVVIGIFMESNTGNVTSEIYNNSVSINGSTFPNASSLCIALNSVGETCRVKNNVFANYTSAQSGVAHHLCVYANAVSQYGNASSLSDYNVFYLADTAGGFVGRASSNYHKTLAQWQAAMTLNPGTDANSLVANPNFVNNATNLHSKTTSTILDGKGTTPPAYITTDYDCETRNTPHDIGFDDYTPGCPADGGTIAPAADSVCANTTYTMTATGFSHPNNSYQWMVSTTNGGPYSNVTDGSGANTTSYTTGSLTSGTKYYVLKATCANGSFDLSNQLVLTVSALPTNTVTASGPTTFCSGGSVVLNATVAANRSYQWKKGSKNISGATAAAYTATASGNYKVIITNTLTGCSKTTSNPIVVTVNATPAAVITPQGPLSFCAGDSVVLQANTDIGLTYKWKKGSAYLSGETQSAYVAKTAGTYRVEVTSSNGCSKLSGSKTAAIICREYNDELVANETIISIFPNPASDELNIEFPANEDFEIEILNTLGEQLLYTKNENTINISDLPDGVYQIKVFNAKHSYVQKLIKQ